MINIIQKTISVNGSSLHLLHPENDDSIFGTLSCLGNGGFSLEKLPVNNGDIYIDIGCNVGVISLILAKVNSTARIFSFDASHTSIQCLRMAAAINQITNIQAFHLAIGDSRERGIKFYSNGKEVSCLIEEGKNAGANEIFDSCVDKVAIDDIFDSPLLGIDRVKFLKMDIEGGEFCIFERLFSSRPDILDRIDFLNLEIHQFKQFGPDRLRQRVLERFGDKAFIIE